ncbi:MAG: tetratricopeptide repeat protein [Pyrinomonadaceae bacterium]
MKPSLIKLTLLSLFLFSMIVAIAAQTSREKGISLYQQGKDQEAINHLSVIAKTNKNDSEALNYLGLAYLNLSRFKDARKTLQKAVKAAPQNATIRANLAYAYLLSGKTNSCQREIERVLDIDPNNATAFYIRGISYLWERKYDETISDADKAIELDKDFADAYILKTDGLMHRFGRKWSETGQPLESASLIEEAVAVLKNCQGDCLLGRNGEKIRERSEGLGAFMDYFRSLENAGDESAGTSPEETPIKFLKKFPPSYTDSARQANEQGDVILAILFGADAQIKYIIVLEGLRYGLTEKSIEAARRIQFEPATRDGKPVSVVKRVQFTFTIY